MEHRIVVVRLLQGRLSFRDTGLNGFVLARFEIGELLARGLRGAGGLRRRAVVADDIPLCCGPLRAGPRCGVAFPLALVFPALDTPSFAAALDLARASAEFRETGRGDARRYRARFWSSDAAKLRDLFQLVGGSDATEVLIDDRPVPYARELWLPLVWFLLPR